MIVSANDNEHVLFKECYDLTMVHLLSEIMRNKKKAFLIKPNRKIS